MDIRKQVKEVLDAFPDVDYHHSLIDDLTDMLNNTGISGAFVGKFLTNLINLSNYKNQTHIKLPANFEKLKQEENLFSMHIKVKNCNARILYSFLSDGTVLLYGFFERSGKKKTDYTNAKRIAKIRKSELIKEETL